MRHRGGPRRLGELERRSELRERLRTIRVLLKLWPELVGDPELASHSWPIGCAGRRLEVGVDAPVWQQHLAFRAPRILAELERRLPHLGCERLEARYVPPSPPPLPSHRTPPRRRPPELDPERIARIRDPELRAAFEALWRLSRSADPER